jgi:hypothetical protein
LFRKFRRLGAVPIWQGYDAQPLSCLNQKTQKATPKEQATQHEMVEALVLSESPEVSQHQPPRPLLADSSLFHCTMTMFVSGPIADIPGPEW